ncbi:peroxiredoxin [Pannonibacter sp.]|uniref:peroxiredoxin n=1 Tax=Pannonibacter sp. TaxID=1906786 RepID=UPI003F70DBED
MTNLNDVDWTNLPEPINDGAADHLPGRRVPAVMLASTVGEAVDLSSLSGTTVVYVYPVTGRPGLALPAGWDAIPGARGCTPQSCAFRDHFKELKRLGVDHLFGLSTQTTEYQREAAERMHLPFPLLSDSQLELQRSLGLPAFVVDGMTLLKRVTVIIRNGDIRKAFYSVFPPDRNAEDVICWLRSAN